MTTDKNESPESVDRPTKILKLSSSDQEDSETTMLENPKSMQRYLIAIEYIGTNFSGAEQRAPNCRTVVGVLQSAFHKFIRQPVLIFCSIQTACNGSIAAECKVFVKEEEEFMTIHKNMGGFLGLLTACMYFLILKECAGVHALSNVCHVDVERISKRKPGEVLPPHEPSVVKNAVNHFLRNEGDIMITDVRCVAADFHARYKTQERTYFYRLLSGPESLSTFEKDRAWHVPEELDLLAMQEACKVLEGLHDFSSFMASGCQVKSPIRNIDELNVIEVFPSPYFPSAKERETQSLMGESCGNSDQNKTEWSIGESSLGFGMRRRHRCFVVTARARSFLYNQVRFLVGAIKSVGTGDLTVSDVERILEAKSVTANAPMAPACGLYLAHVKYDLP